MTQQADYHKLDPKLIVETVRKLQTRVEERFPERGLAKVAAELTLLAQEAGPRAQRIARGNVVRRMAGMLIAALLVLGLLLYGLQTVHDDGVTDLASFLQTLEAGIASLVFLGAAIVSLVTFDARRARTRILRALDEIRSMAHVVDMHQLAKSPEKLVLRGAPTPSSPDMESDPFLMGRYLDYCSEMLSLMSKIAAVYVRDSDDPVALSAADEIESLTGGLSMKLWQKILLLSQMPRGAA